MDIDPKDYKYISNPSKDFNPKRNEAVIAQTIKEADEYHSSYGQAMDAALGERWEVMAQFGDYKLNRSGGKTMRQFLGDKLYTDLVGEKLISKVKAAKTVDKFGRKLVML
jgi:hypothetical protein